MNCPFCAEDIKDDASVCKHCRRDISIPKSLYVDIRANAEAIEALTAELAELRLLLENLPAATQEAVGPLPRHGRWDVLTATLLPACLLLLAHYAIVIRWDLSTLQLRVASIVIPILCAMFHRASLRRGIGWNVAIAVLLGISVVLSMSYVVGLVDKTPLLPTDGHGWREMTEYMASISLSYMTGVLVMRLLRGHELRVNAGPTMARGVKLILVSLDAGFTRTERLEKAFRTLQSVVNATAPAGAAAGAIYTGIHGFVQ